MLAGILHRRLWPPPAPAGILVAMGATMAAVQLAFYVTINLAGVATAIFLQYTGPAMIAGYLALRGEALGARRGLALVLATAGCFVLVGGDRIRVGLAAVGVGLLAAALLAANTLLIQSRVARGAPPWPLLGWTMAVAGVMWSLYLPPWRAVQPRSPGEWAIVAAIVLFATVAPFGLFASALRVLDAARASIVAMLEPVVGAVGALILLGEGLGVAQIAGGGLILLAVGLLQAEGWRRRPAA